MIIRKTKPYVAAVICVFILLIFQNTLAQRPLVPVFLSVSIDTTTGNPVLRWQANPEPDIEAYYVSERIDANNNFDIYKVSNDTFHIDDIHKADKQSEAYKLSVSNTSGERNLGYSTTLSTLFAQASFDSCLATNTISWSTAFKLWEGETKNYEILRRIDGAPFESIALVGPSEKSFSETGINPNRQYYYIVKANKKKSSLVIFSNKVNVFTEMAVLPAYINVDSVFVTNNSGVRVSFTIDSASEINHYRIIRSTSKNNLYDTLYDFTKTSKNHLVFEDNEVNPNQKNYYYKIIGINYCGEKMVTSNAGSNILLKGAENDQTVTLSWSQYQTFAGNTGQYTVYRSPSESQFFNTASDTVFLDDLSQLDYDSLEGKFCYYVVARETGNPYQIAGAVKSNKICVTVETKIRMANALNPNSQVSESNREIRPYLSFYPKDYYFAVYDRWGKKMFETCNPSKGWDGTTLSGQKALEGVYVYQLKITSYKNKEYKKTGAITLVYQ